MTEWYSAEIRYEAEHTAEAIGILDRMIESYCGCTDADWDAPCKRATWVARGPELIPEGYE